MVTSHTEPLPPIHVRLRAYPPPPPRTLAHATLGTFDMQDRKSLSLPSAPPPLAHLLSFRPCFDCITLGLAGQSRGDLREGRSDKEITHTHTKTRSEAWPCPPGKGGRVKTEKTCWQALTSRRKNIDKSLPLSHQPVTEPLLSQHEKAGRSSF